MVSKFPTASERQRRNIHCIWIQDRKDLSIINNADLSVVAPLGCQPFIGLSQLSGVGTSCLHVTATEAQLHITAPLEHTQGPWFWWNTEWRNMDSQCVERHLLEAMNAEQVVYCTYWTKRNTARNQYCIDLCVQLS